MLSKLISIALIFFFLSTAKADDLSILLSRLDHDEYIERQKAINEFIDLRFDGVQFLQNLDESKFSLETINAIKTIVTHYYLEASYDIVDIWYLPIEYRFINNEDIAKKYYDLSLKMLSKIKKQNYVESYSGYDDVAILATNLYFKDKLRIGEDIQKIKTRMEELKYLKKITKMVYESNRLIDWYKPPPAVEDEIQQMKNNGFKLMFYNYNNYDFFEGDDEE